MGSRTASFVAVVRQITMANKREGQVFRILLDYASVKGETLETLTKFGDDEQVRVVIQPTQVSMDELPRVEKERLGLFAQDGAGPEHPAAAAQVAGGEERGDGDTAPVDASGPPRDLAEADGGGGSSGAAADDAAASAAEGPEGRASAGSGPAEVGGFMEDHRPEIEDLLGAGTPDSTMSMPLTHFAAELAVLGCRASYDDVRVAIGRTGYLALERSGRGYRVRLTAIEDLQAAGDDGDGPVVSAVPPAPVELAAAPAGGAAE